ncbi:MAG: NAD(P)-dependent alcohol dehydrogenase [archaeon]|nr:NAD(P)-dependent alcohol dehydrogenase [archaeon]
MKAIVLTKYGPPDNLQLKDVEKPIPKDNEILIKIHATTVTMGDCEMRNLIFPGALKYLMRLAIGFSAPRKRFSIFGQEFAGEIESIGSEVKNFKKGDQIFASTGFHFGAYAEYVCLPESGTIALKPENISYEEAASVPTGGLEAVSFLRKANIQKGQKILIRGASGSIGTFGIQLAKYFGAEVVAVGNPTSLEVMKSIGADVVIDYTKENFTQHSETYDMIFDIIGRDSFSVFLGLLKKNGVYLLANPKMSLINHEKREAKKNEKKLIYRNMDEDKERIEQLNFLKKLLESGKIKSVIDKRYSLEKMVEAHKYVESGQKTGNVVINVVEKI